MRKLTFYADNKIIEIDAEDTNNKNMYLKIKDGKIVVLIPKRMPDKTVEKFVAEHYDKFTTYLEKKNSKQYFSYEEKFFYIFGKKVRFETIAGFTTTKVVKKGTRYYVQAINDTEQSISEIVEFFVKNELQNYIEKALQKFEGIMQTSVHTFKVSNKTTAWGTNYLAKKHISFAQTLGHYSKNIIDYVIIHELAHDKHPDHSNEFWKSVEEFAPNYKEFRKALKHDQELAEDSL